MGRALCNAHGSAVQAFGIFDTGGALNDEALAAVEVDRTLAQAEAHSPQEGRGRIAIKNIDFTRLQRGAPILSGQSHKADFGGIAQYPGGKCAAIVSIQSLEIALRAGWGGQPVP